jgi:hypothetical protein
VKFGITVVYSKFLSRREFHEIRRSGSHTLLESAIVSLSFMKIGTLRAVHIVSMSFTKIGTVRAVNFTLVHK